jgi:YD repeat-containing protein
MKTVIATTLLLFATAAFAEPQQTRIYGPDGRSIGTAAPQGEGTIRYYDARGRSTGTSTTIGNTTRYYDASGQSIGSSAPPARR